MFIKTTLSIILCLIFKSHLVSSQTTLVAPVNKDTATSLYTITLSGSNRYFIDISALYSWKRCQHPPQYPLVAHFDFLCMQAQYLNVPYCYTPYVIDTSICFVTPANPVTGSCIMDLLITSNETVSWTDGANAMATITMSCAPESLFQSLPTGIVGLASLGLTHLSLHAQFPNSFPNVKRKFAMCLPRTGSEGTIFFGDGPYNLDPQPDFDVSTLVTYVPFTLPFRARNANYVIGPKALSLSGNSIPMSDYGTIFLTTAVPYMTIRSYFYNQFLNLFKEEMKGVPEAEKVEPFSVCYNTTGIGHDGVGLDIPKIGLEFDNGTWTIYGSNSMKYVGADVACLAILDGGENQESVIVMGSYQMEEHLLVFDDDVYNSKFGFSSSLPRKGLSCGRNFSLRTNV